MTDPEFLTDYSISERLIDEWHETTDPNDERSLHEFLGVTWDEYKEIAREPESFERLVRERNPVYTAKVIADNS